MEADEAEPMTGLGAAKEGVLEAAGVAGHSKSQETPCLRQLPQVGWTSSHCYRIRPDESGEGRTGE